MSCSVAISSPAFSPSRLSCKISSPSSVFSSDGSPSSTSCGSSPFRSRFRPVGLRFSAAAARDQSPVDGVVRVLKRKRPAMIAIPIGEAVMLAKDGEGRGESIVEVDGDRCGVVSKRGKRRLEIEDRHRVEMDVNGDSQMAFFGIFDGHGGAKAAEFASKNIGGHIVEEVMRGVEEGVCVLEEAVRVAYIKTDEEFLKEGAGGGSCCVTAFVKNGDLVVSNTGDCRAVLSRAGVAEALTSDHKPSREDERDRIESLGGYVDYCRGVWRVQGTLAVSRGIGDMHLKQWVIAEPETRTVSIKPECEFLILASDGLWDKVSNQEAVDIARPLCRDSAKPSPLAACRKLVDLSSSRGSVDDTSVMIIQLGHFSRPGSYS